MNIRKNTFIIILFLYHIGVVFPALSQEAQDSLAVKKLNEVIIRSYHKNDLERLGDLHQNFIVAGKKNEVILVQNLNANLAEKTGRQIFAKVPGAFVYDMDGSGNQMNLSTRGLDPHRSWEYNVRQNGIMTNSDIYGYPASHYSPPMESIRKIELIRGTSSLQYGAQFGGMINYVTKTADTTKPISFESINSAGSYDLFSSYNAVGGKVGKWQYYAYYHKRVSDGYRKNARSDAESQFVSLTYQAARNFRIKAETGRSTYRFRIPGPLTDALFNSDPRQSTRSGNYFSPDIYVPSLSFDWDINARTRLSWVNSAVLGTRSSVQYIALANVADDPTKNRQVDIDGFNSYASELKLTREYKIGNQKSILIGGVRVINNRLHRRQVGKGTTGTEYDLSITGNWGRDLQYKTKNVAFFAENLFYLTSKLKVSPSFRVESGNTDMTGTISYYAPEKLPTSIKHTFPLFGVTAQYQLKKDLELYAGWAQAYRPVIFSDIIPPTALDRTNPDLKDASGSNTEIGLRGHLAEKLNFDVTYFQIDYKNRIGSLILPDASTGTNYVYKTNTGTTVTRGLEVFAEFKAYQTNKGQISLFTSTSYFDAEYTKGSVVLTGENKSIVGNKLETVPEWISRSGLNVQFRKFSASLQYSYVAESFSDALNTVTPGVDGAKGVVPSYSLWDLNTSIGIAKNYTFKLGINNLTNTQYFTKRPTGYPGVGVWSSDGRSIVGTFVVQI